MSCNPVVKAFGAEGREDAHLGRVLARWRTRTWVTWTRHILTGTLQQAILMVLRVVVIGLALLFWWQGTATLGDVTFVLTAYGVINGYLRDIGHMCRTSSNRPATWRSSLPSMNGRSAWKTGPVPRR